MAAVDHGSGRRFHAYFGTEGRAAMARFAGIFRSSIADYNTCRQRLAVMWERQRLVSVGRRKHACLPGGRSIIRDAFLCSMGEIGRYRRGPRRYCGPGWRPAARQFAVAAWRRNAVEQDARRYPRGASSRFVHDVSFR